MRSLWCSALPMAKTRISPRRRYVNEEWLEAAREVLGTDTNVATINRGGQADDAGRPPASLQRICFERDVASVSHLA